MKKLLTAAMGLFVSNANANISWEDFVTEAHAALTAKQNKLMTEFKLGEHERFDWDQESGTLIFSNDGKVAVIAKVQFVGSISTTSNTWLWSWASSYIYDNVKDQMHIVREFGESKGYEALIIDKWEADEIDGWEMTSVTSYLLEAKGAYRTTQEAGFTYMVITDISWAN
ncbi:hypothetical protein RAL05_004509 [Vibrio vulnificus]|nr:hypothetical protein [Vibrio vulnificus]